MAILKNLGELTRIVRDRLYDETKVGSGTAGITVADLLSDVNAIRGTHTSEGAIRRSLRELRKLGIVDYNDSKRPPVYTWNPATVIPGDYLKRTVPQANQNTTSGGTVPDSDEEKRRILRQKLEDRMAEITNEKQKSAESEKIPLPKRDAMEGITRNNGQVYQPRDLAGHVDVKVLERLRKNGIFALLSGPPGTGKTVLVDATFGNSEGGLFVITADENTNTEDFMGQWSPTGNPDHPYVWVDGPLVLAMKAGGVLFVDDATLANPKVLAVMYPAMDGRGEVTNKQHIVNGKPEVVKSQPGFYVVAAHNPGVHGAILTDALASRFIAQIWVETDLELAASLGVNEKFIRLTKNLMTKRDKANTGVWVPQLRELLAARDFGREFGDEAAAANLLGVAPEDSQDDIAAEMVKVFGKEIARLELGHQL